MKSLLARIGLPRAFGLCVEEATVTLSEVVSTPLGPVEIGRRQEQVTSEGLPAALKRLMQPRSRHDRCQRIPVAVALPWQRVYFVTRPIQNTTADPSPHVLLREALRSVSVPVSEMAVDVVKAQPDKRPLASIVACSAEYMRSLLETLKRCGVRPVRVEPGPCALLRAANRHRAGRAAKVVLRFFFSDHEAVAVLVAQQLPVVWRYVDLRPGDEASTIVSACRSLLIVSRDCGIESPLDVLMLHGRSDLARLVDVEWLRQQLEVPVRWFEGPALGNAEIAFASGLGCWSPEQQAFDLSRSLKPRASLRELFPWRQVVVQAVLLLCMTLFLLNRYGSLQESYAALEVRNAENPRTASMREAQLEEEKTDLERKVAAVQKFLGTRMLWTTHERQLAECLPANAFLASFQGACELETADQQRGQGKPKKSLVVQGTVLLRQKGLMPREIDVFLDRLRASPILKRDFPVVELAALKPGQSLVNETPVASFTVLCLPKNSKAKGEPPRKGQGQIAQSDGIHETHP
jgi:hypothetical protein